MLHRTSKQHDVNKDKWIGVGGHLEEGESPEDCLLREVKEETGLTLTGWRFHGIVTFVYGVSGQGEKADHLKPSDIITEHMYLYTATDAAEGFDHALPDCDEGVLKWVDIDRVPELNLWDGDRIFLRLLAEDAPVFSLKLVYDDCGNLLEHKFSY